MECKKMETLGSLYEQFRNTISFNPGGNVIITSLQRVYDGVAAGTRNVKTKTVPFKTFMNWANRCLRAV